MAKEISAIEIKRLFYKDVTETEAFTADVTGAVAKAALTSFKEVKNIHQATWNLEEGEASQEKYKNQLTGKPYRTGGKEDGEVEISFIIGQYSYSQKAEFLGGTATESSWKRAKEAVEKKMAFIALTRDDQYIVLPYTSIEAREVNTDNAIGISVNATMLEPKTEGVSSEYWFDKSELA